MHVDIVLNNNDFGKCFLKGGNELLSLTLLSPTKEEVNVFAHFRLSDRLSVC